MTPDKLRAQLVDLAIRQRRAEWRGEFERAAALEAAYTALQPQYAAMLDAVELEQGQLEVVG